MNREDIIRMARKAGGLNCDCCLPEPEPHEMQKFIERFAALVAEEVRGRTIESEKAGWLYALDKVVKREREPVQVPVLEFVEMVMEKEHLVGKPLVWAQWPNEAQK